MTRTSRKGLVFSSGGSCAGADGSCPLPQTGGTRTAMLQPRFGGNQTRKQGKQKGKGCSSCDARPLMMPLPPGITPSQELLQGGSCGCGATAGRSPWRNLTGGHIATELSDSVRTGGACPCQAVSSLVPVALGGYKQAKRRTRRAAKRGGYRPTKRNLKYLAKWKRGESIGFTMRSSLKAKGLIPRANGTYKVSPKYQRTQ